MSIDIFSLSIIVTGLAFFGIGSMYVHRHLLKRHQSLQYWLIACVIKATGFTVMFFYVQFEATAILLHSICSILTFLFLYLGVRKLETRNDALSRKRILWRTSIFVMVLAFLLYEQQTTVTYLIHDTSVIFLSALTLLRLGEASNRGRHLEYLVPFIAFLLIFLGFLGRIPLTVAGEFRDGPEHFYNEILFLFIIFGNIGWIIGLPLILYRQVQRQTESKLQIDGLTGILNREGILSVSSKWIESSKAFYVYVIDLNGFKSINDSHGHLAGDYVLKAFANHVKRNLSLDAAFGRVGGDEFIILLPRKLSDERVKHDLELDIDGTLITLSSSIGEAVFPKDGNSIETLVQVADGAMYRMKRDKKRQSQSQVSTECLTATTSE